MFDYFTHSLYIVASSWSLLYLPIKDARSFENKVYLHIAFLWFTYLCPSINRPLRAWTATCTPLCLLSVTVTFVISWISVLLLLYATINVGTILWPVFLFTSRLFYPEGKTPYRFVRRLDGALCRCGRSFEEEYWLSVPGIETRSSSLWFISVLTEIFQFLTLNLPTTTIVAQPFNVIKWQVKFNPVA